MFKIMSDIVSKFPPKRKKTPKGWETFHGSSCCIHNGETRDKRGRAGVIIKEDMLSYNCFNCSFKANFIPGRQMNRKFRNLLTWMGIDDNEIKRLMFESLRLKHEIGEEVQPMVEEVKIDFKEITIPGNVTLLKNPELVNYITTRGFTLDDADWLQTDETSGRLNKRVIIPFYWNTTIVGYTGRLITDSKMMKYKMDKPAHYVYNINNQAAHREYVLLMEGPLDAIAVDGIALCGNYCDNVQADIINDLDRQVVVVPDRNQAGQALIDIALKYHWSVSFPDWGDDVDDVATAMKCYGKIYTMQSIMTNIVTNDLKIKLLRKKIG